MFSVSNSIFVVCAERDLVRRSHLYVRCELFDAQVYGSQISYYVNGTDDGFAARGTSVLIGSVADGSGASGRIGLTASGNNWRLSFIYKKN